MKHLGVLLLWAGLLCERSTYVTSMVSTTSQPCTCYNGGTCTYSDYRESGFYCDCPLGYMGEICEINAFRPDQCDNTYCSNGSTCWPRMWPSGYICLCPPDYTGIYCESPSHCYCAHGFCRPTDFSENPQYYCDCHPGYTGQACDVRMTCDQDPCHNGGVCKDYNADFLCTCPDNFAGLYCEQEIGYPGIDIKISTDDASVVIKNEQRMSELAAYVINLYCATNLEECCNSFGYSADSRVTVPMFIAIEGFMNYVEFDQTSFVVRIRALNVVRLLNEVCLVTDHTSNPEDDLSDSSVEDDNDPVYLSPDLLQSIVENYVDQIELATGVKILGVEHSDLSQDDDIYDEVMRHIAHSKALAIGLSVTLSIVGLLVTGGVILAVYVKCYLPRRNRQLAATSQSVPAVTGPQFMYQQLTTPNDLFLGSDANGMPPAYQHVVNYPASTQPSYDTHIQSPMYGGTPQTKNNVLPPINLPVVGGVKSPEGGQLNTVTNPAPPSDTVYHFQAPCVKPVGRNG